MIPNQTQSDFKSYPICCFKSDPVWFQIRPGLIPNHTRSVVSNQPGLVPKQTIWFQIIHVRFSSLQQMNRSPRSRAATFQIMSSVISKLKHVQCSYMRIVKRFEMNMKQNTKLVSNVWMYFSRSVNVSPFDAISHYFVNPYSVCCCWFCRC